MALLIDWTSDNAYTNPFLMGQLFFKRHEQCFVCLVLAMFVPTELFLAYIQN